MKMPDFVEWAKHLIDREDVAIALEQAFNQGLALGKRQTEIYNSIKVHLIDVEEHE